MTRPKNELGRDLRRSATTATAGNWLTRAYPFSGLLMALVVGVCTTFPGSGAELRNNFVEREVTLDPEGVITGSNTNATRESGEPQHADKTGGRSVWVSWIAPTNGVATFRTTGSTFDTLLAAYYFKRSNDTTLDELEEAASNDDNDTVAPASIIRFGAEAGVRYEIAVDGYHGTTGDIRLEWDFTEIDTVAPVVLDAPKDRALRLGDSLTLAVNLQSNPDMRLQWRFNGDSFGAEGPTLVIPSLQLTNVGRYSLRIRIGDGGDEVRFETAPVEIQINSEGQTNALARDKIFDAVDSPLTPDDHGSGASLAFIRAASGGLAAASIGVSRGYNGAQVFNTIYATPDPNEPQHCGVAGGASYWFAYEPPTNGTLHLDTTGSLYDTVLAAYEVPAGEFTFQNLISLACDNDGVAFLGPSRIQIQVTVGKQYLVAVDGVAGVRGIAQLNYLLEAAPQPDLVPPSLTITSPSAINIVTTNASITIAGTAADNVSVSNILVSTPAATIIARIPGSGDWSVTLDLAPGTNVLYFTALDPHGNSSETLGRAIFYKVSSPLTLEIGGEGKISGAMNGQIMEIGRQYILTAKPARGYVFSNWSGATNPMTPNLRFVMSSNATLTAHFIPNPFIPVAGSYHAVFANASSLERWGWIKLDLRSSGAFSGSIRQAHRRLSFAGQFDVLGHSTLQVSGSGSDLIYMNLYLNIPGGDELRGTLLINSSPVDLSTRRASFHRRTNPATNYAGRYTLLFPGATNGGVAPVGDGYAVMTISAGGSLNAAGVLADGTPFTQSVPLASDGGWPLFTALYRGHGLLAGNLRVRPPVDEGNDIEGIASWLRLPGRSTATYTNGFLLHSTAAGSAYTNPVAARLIDTNLAALTLADASGTTLVTNTVGFAAGGRLTNGEQYPVTLKAYPKTGLIRGSTTLPGATLPTTLRGAVLQRQLLGGGHFQHSNTIGRITLAP